MTVAVGWAVQLIACNACPLGIATTRLPIYAHTVVRASAMLVVEKHVSRAVPTRCSVDCRPSRKGAPERVVREIN
eukprot:2465606-Prymnesium_polylepis.1